MSAASPTKIWIDCSGSVDDILALIILLDASGYDVVAVSCVRGKTTVDQGTRNISKVLHTCKRTDIPIYCGSNEPLLSPFPQLKSHYEARETSARTTFLSSKKSEAEVDLNDKSHAAIHLVQAAKRMEGELILVSLGPLTNIAVACILDPLFPLYVGKYVAVGGSEISGDITQMAEFNFFVDPEAAQIAMGKFPQMLLVQMSLGLGQKYAWSIEEEWLEKAETAKAGLIEGILTLHEELGDNHEWIGSAAIAAAIVGTPDLVSISKRARCEIETIGKVTRANILLVTEIDAVQFHQVLRNVIV